MGYFQLGTSVAGQLAATEVGRRDDSDLDGLPPETRETRLTIRRSIEASLARIGEDSAQKHDR